MCKSLLPKYAFVLHGVFANEASKYFLVQVNVYKQPITDPGKNSKKGLLSLQRDEKGQFVTMQEGKGSADEVSPGNSRHKMPASLLALFVKFVENFAEVFYV